VKKKMKNNKFFLLLTILLACLESGVYSVSTCYTGTMYSGSAAQLQQNLTQTNCPIGATDACIVIFKIIFFFASAAANLL
jgi:L-asparagine transporter-like permease